MKKSVKIAILLIVAAVFLTIFLADRFYQDNDEQEGTDEISNSSIFDDEDTVVEMPAETEETTPTTPSMSSSYDNTNPTPSDGDNNALTDNQTGTNPSSVTENADAIVEIIPTNPSASNPNAPPSNGNGSIFENNNNNSTPDTELNDIHLTSPSVTSPLNNSTSSYSSTSYTEYTVKNGDTLWDISKKEYGTGIYMDLIYNANKDVITNKNFLKPGTKLKIPEKPQKKTANVYSSSSSSSTLYTVKNGDTLWDISKKMYGTGKYMDLIYEANKSAIPNKNFLKPGTKLNIPPKPESKAKVKATKKEPVVYGSNIYIVKDGDTLEKISKKIYNAKKYWPKIWEANKNICPQPRKISIGMQLTIPVLPGVNMNYDLLKNPSYGSSGESNESNSSFSIDDDNSNPEDDNPSATPSPNPDNNVNSPITPETPDDDNYSNPDNISPFDDDEDNDSFGTND